MSKATTDNYLAALKPFKTVYIITFVFMILTDIILITLIFTVWIHLKVYFISELLRFRLTFLYYMFIISPMVKIGFEGLEIIRYLKYLKSDNRDKEGAYRVARGFIGTRIYRIYDLIVVIVVIILMEIEHFAILIGVDSSSGQAEFMAFYFWFRILLYSNLLPLLISPQIIKYSIDRTNRQNIVKAIVYSIIWIIVLALILNLDKILIIILVFS